jgi:hypothetical protein
VNNFRNLSVNSAAWLAAKSAKQMKPWKFNVTNARAAFDLNFNRNPPKSPLGPRLWHNGNLKLIPNRRFQTSNALTLDLRP